MPWDLLTLGDFEYYPIQPPACGEIVHGIYMGGVGVELASFPWMTKKRIQAHIDFYEGYPKNFHEAVSRDMLQDWKDRQRKFHSPEPNRDYTGELQGSFPKIAEGAPLAAKVLSVSPPRILLSYDSPLDPAITE